MRSPANIIVKKTSGFVFPEVLDFITKFINNSLRVLRSMTEGDYIQDIPQEP